MGDVGLASDEVVLHKDSRVLRSLLHVGVSLSVLSDTQELLDLILREACNLSHAEAGRRHVSYRLIGMTTLVVTVLLHN